LLRLFLPVYPYATTITINSSTNAVKRIASFFIQVSVLPEAVEKLQYKSIAIKPLLQERKQKQVFVPVVYNVVNNCCCKKTATAISL
jgi:hypothetical protein